MAAAAFNHADRSSMEQKLNPTWGYKSDGSAQIFDLKEGESLPDGWSTQLEPWNHPNSRHLHTRPAEQPTQEEPGAVDDTQPKRRGRPRKNHDEEPGAELASELRDGDLLPGAMGNPIGR